MDLYVSTWMESKRYAHDTRHLFQIGFVRHHPLEIQLERAHRFFEQDCFAAIDLYGDELAQPIEKFIPFFRKAKEKKMILRAHVGEFGSADDVWRAVEELELDEVQHGIAAASSTQVMNFLADNNIRLNICPTSNIILSRVDSLKNHPIRKLFDNGVKVTVNTDNLLTFGSTLSQEFLALYDCGLFNANELNKIRENSFT
jgi:adenosine deaminase